MRKRLIGICLAVQLGFVTQVAQAQQQAPATAEPVTLQEAVGIALANNNAIALARDRYNRSRAVTRETRAAGLPQVDLQAQTQRMGPTATIDIPGAGEIEVGSDTSTTATLVGSQVLDLNRRISLATGISGLASRIEAYGLSATEQQVVLNVQSAYYNVLRAQAQRDVAQSAVDTAEERLRIARAEFEAGTKPRFDVTSAEVQVANQRQALISATTAIDTNKTVLRNVMGLDPAEPIATAPVDVPVQPVATTAEQAAQLAITQRPEIKAAETGVELQRRSITFARRERIPGVAAFANYSYNADTSFFQPDRLTWVIGVNASMPVFTGGAISARVDQAKADLSAAQNNLDQTKLDVTQDVKTSLLNLNDAYQRTQTAQQNVTLAEEALRLAQVRYQAGISLQVEVSDAETNLTQARSNLVNAQYDYASALAAYQRATSTQPQLGQTQLVEAEN